MPDTRFFDLLAVRARISNTKLVVVIEYEPVNLFSLSDECGQGWHIRCVRHLESIPQVVPEADVLLVAGFQQCEPGIARVAAAADSGGYFAPRHLHSNVIFGSGCLR